METRRSFIHERKQIVHWEADTLSGKKASHRCLPWIKKNNSVLVKTKIIIKLLILITLRNDTEFVRIFGSGACCL